MSTAAPEGAGAPHLIEQIATAVRACPAVADLHGGAFGTVATYLPGRQVRGIRATGDDDPGTIEGVEIHVAGRYPHPVAEIAAQVRAAVRTITAIGDVVVTVEDYL